MTADDSTTVTLRTGGSYDPVPPPTVKTVLLTAASCADHVGGSVLRVRNAAFSPDALTRVAVESAAMGAHLTELISEK